MFPTNLFNNGNGYLMNDSENRWADSHCHFDFDEFSTDRDTLWRTCRNDGMAYMLVPGIEPDQWPRLQRMHHTYDGLVYAVGLHPWWIATHGPKAENGGPNLLIDALHKAAGQDGCKAIGECGLDALIDEPLERQESVLEWHLQAASELNLPVVLHCVRAHNPLIRMLKRFRLSGGVIHAFNGSLQLAQTYHEMGFYLGVGGSITYERANKTRSALAGMPLEALLLETDAPDMPLCGQQGQRNSPANIPRIIDCLATLRDDTTERIAEVTTRNLQSLLAL